MQTHILVNDVLMEWRQLLTFDDPRSNNDVIVWGYLSGCVYELSCLQCSATYIAQTGRQLGQRIKEYKSSAPSRIPSAVKEHSTEARHTIDWDNVKILDREDREFPPPSKGGHPNKKTLAGAQTGPRTRDTLNL